MQLASQTANCQCALLILDPVSFIEIENYLCFTSLWPLLTSHPKVLLSWATLHNESAQLIDLDLQKSEFPFQPPTQQQRGKTAHLQPVGQLQMCIGLLFPKAIPAIKKRVSFSHHSGVQQIGRSWKRTAQISEMKSNAELEDRPALLQQALSFLKSLVAKRIIV